MTGAAEPPAPPPVPTLAVGSVAPDFTLPDQHGARVRLSAYRGESTVLLVFYPYAFTGVCTAELGALRDRLSELRAAGSGAAVLACSCDTMFSLRVYAEQERLDFPLLSDHWPHGATATAYGVLDEERGCARRGTFVIDRDGVVRWSVLNAIPDPRSVEDYLAALEAA